MTAKKFWPEVADALAELNDRARTELGPIGSKRQEGGYPWPTWAPAPGSWVRGVWEGADPADRIAHPTTWHVTGRLIFETAQENLFQLKPLCGREIRIEPDLSDRVRDLLKHGCRRSSFEVRGEAAVDDKECWHCRRKLDRDGEPGPGRLLRPWANLIARA